jgi:hypothetical protein
MSLFAKSEHNIFVVANIKYFYNTSIELSVRPIQCDAFQVSENKRHFFDLSKEGMGNKKENPHLSRVG